MEIQKEKERKLVVVSRGMRCNGDGGAGSREGGWGSGKDSDLGGDGGHFAPLQ